jgi:poly(ribitol-phosphate) beta-N-acetylglucosaminyltransferase
MRARPIDSDSAHDAESSTDHRSIRPKVSVIVPVFDPGPHIDDLLESLLGQTLPPEEIELIFVDDGSTDGTPARLDALAARHDHVRVEHIPNSGWPGKPRNVGLGMARGDYVLFADNDDWLERDALERLHAMAEQDRADIVIGKVVGHGKKVPRRIFEANRHGMRFDSDLLLALLTPHKLFRRGLLDEHGLRFPEGRRRLEDHVLVVSAYFAAERISILADRPVYHWMRRDEQDNASYRRFDADAYFDNVREVLDLVESRTEPGALREHLLLHWYHGKMLGRVGGRDWLWREADFRRELYEAVRALALERFGEDVHERLPFNLRLRSKLLRRGDFDALGRLSRFERRLTPVVRIRGIERGGTHVVLRLESWYGSEKTRLRFERKGDRTFWLPPTDQLVEDVPEADREVTGELRAAKADVFLRNAADRSEYLLPARTRPRLEVRDGGRVRPKLQTVVPIAPTAAAAGGPLPPGRWEVHITLDVAGFQRTVPVLRRGEPLVLTTYAPGRIVVGDAPPPPPRAAVRAYRRLPWPVIGTLRRARAVAARRG